jgi:hypothetical protein
MEIDLTNTRPIPGFADYHIRNNGEVVTSKEVVASPNSVLDRVTLKQGKIVENYYIGELLCKVWYVGANAALIRDAIYRLLPYRYRNPKQKIMPDTARAIRRAYLELESVKLTAMRFSVEQPTATKIILRYQWDDV